VTERKSVFERANWLDEMKGHLVVAEILLPVTMESKDQALVCKEVKSRLAKHHCPFSVGIT